MWCVVQESSEGKLQTELGMQQASHYTWWCWVLFVTPQSSLKKTCLTEIQNQLLNKNPSDADDEVELHVLGCRLTYYGQTVTSAEAWFNIAIRPRKPEGWLGRTAQDGHLDSHTAPELWPKWQFQVPFVGQVVFLAQLRQFRCYVFGKKQKTNKKTGFWRRPVSFTGPTLTLSGPEFRHSPPLAPQTGRSAACPALPTGPPGYLSYWQTGVGRYLSYWQTGVGVTYGTDIQVWGVTYRTDTDMSTGIALITFNRKTNSSQPEDKL